MEWVDALGLAGRKTSKPRIEFGNHKEGWQHIDERHISGTHPGGAGDLFPEGTTKEQILKVCESGEERYANQRPESANPNV